MVSRNKNTFGDSSKFRVQLPETIRRIQNYQSGRLISIPITWYRRNTTPDVNHPPVYVIDALNALVITPLGMEDLARDTAAFARLRIEERKMLLESLTKVNENGAEKEKENEPRA